MFAVIYQGYVKEGLETEYQKAWHTVANYFVESRGALGSRLHQTQEKLWVAYSCWPDKETRDKSWPGENAPSKELPDTVRNAILSIKRCTDQERNEQHQIKQETCMEVVDDLFCPAKQSQSDEDTCITDLKNLIKAFTQARDWEQFHSPKTLTQALSIEASELMELFLWDNNESSKLSLEAKREAVEHEMGDVLCYLLQLAWEYNIDLSHAFYKKMEINSKRYPIEKAKGNAKKYTILEKSKC
jgi:NTP pyrophosphatase (non-canonical NTP hydrolase)